MAAEDVKSQPATSNASSGTKRKRAGEHKFYAVKNGHKPGVYSNYNDCQAQVKGFKNATFKAFPTAAEAQAFVRSGSDSTTTDKTDDSKVTKFYAVQNGRVPGVYTDWASCQKQTTGFYGAKFKSFATRAEADTFAKGGRPTGGAVGNVSVDADSPADSGDAASNKEPAAKKQRKSNTPAEATGDWEPGDGPLPEDAEDNFDSTIILDPSGKVQYKTEEQKNAKKKVPTGDSKGGSLVIYTDGSSLGNGKKGAFAGVGVFFGPLDERNVSAPLAGPRQTNQRAELTAIQRALNIAPLTRDVEICTDSKYSIDCVTNWIISWKKKDWKTSAGKPVENRDLIEAIDGRMEERKKLNRITKYTWVKGHADNPGNKAADELAVQGARKAMADAKVEA
ncbi:RNase H domain-containing protein [Phyllosticta citribraziliensis]|uniref:ribonuclease H n=1 Tax=Phyllosticta citribraziliensis TaxID=989973 RepID=A0ABR1LGN0_9PEZI